MAYSLSFSIILGDEDTELTLKGQLVNSSGDAIGSEFSSGFSEIGSGYYQLYKSDIPDGHRGGIIIYNDADDSILAFGAINPENAENIDSKISSRGTADAGDIMNLSSAYDAAKSAAPAGEYDSVLDVAISSRSSHSVADIENSLTANHGSGSWISLEGNGANPVIVTISDEDGVIPGINISIKNSDMDALVAGPIASDENGEVRFNIDDGDYVAISPSSPMYSGGVETFTVSGEELDVDVLVEKYALPTPSSPTLCSVYADMISASGVATAAGEGKIEVVGTPNDSPTADASDNLVGYNADNYAVTNAAGRVSIDLVRGNSYSLQTTNGLSVKTLKNVEIPDAASYNITSLI